MAIRFDRIELSDDGNHLYPYIEGTDGYLATQTQHGLLRIGAGNASFSHFFTDRPSFYFNASVKFDGSASAYGGDEDLTNWNNVDAAKFRDKDNTAYYLDPSNTGIALNINGIIDQNFEQTDLNTAWTTPGNSFAEGFIVGRYQSTASNIPSNNDNANWFMNIYSHSSGGTASYGIQLAGSNANSGENALSLRNVSNGGFGSWRKVYHEGHKPTYSELGTMAYSNLTGTPTIPTDFVSKANGGTFSGDIQAPGIYIGSTNTSYDFYNNGTSYLNGATTIDADLSVNGNVTIDNGTSSTLSVKCDNGGNAIVRAGGDGQGTGVFEVTQDNGQHGGGISYNGDGSPSFVSGESSDHITFYRIHSGSRTEVFHYPYNSNTVNFNATPTIGGVNIAKVSDVPSTSSFVDLTSTQTISGAKTFTSTGHKHSGHYYMTAYDSAGNHYPHFLDGSANGGVNVNWRLYDGSSIAVTHEWNTDATFFRNSLRSTVDLRSPIYYDSTNTAFYIDAPGGSRLAQTTFRQGASDQNNTSDTGSIPSTTGAEMLRLEGNYTNGRYTHELAKIDRGGNLPLYLRESKSTANSFTNLVRFGNHSNSQKEFEVFGDAQAYSYYSTGTVTGTAFYDTDNSGRYVDPGSTGDSTFLRGYIRSTKYKRFANTFDSELPSAMPMIGGSDSSIGRGYATVGFDTNGRLAIYERVYTIKISGSGWLNRYSNPIPIFPPSGNHFVVVEDFVVYIDYATRTGIGSSGIANSGNTNAYVIGFFENAQSGNSPGSGQFFTLGVMPRNFVQNATTDQGYYRDVPVHQSRLLPNRGLFLRTGRNCTSTSNAPGGIHYVQIKYRIINTSSEMESDVDYDVNYAGTTSNRVTPLHDVDGSFISY